jgi:hypothetical protein
MGEPSGYDRCHQEAAQPPCKFRLPHNNRGRELEELVRGDRNENYAGCLLRRYVFRQQLADAQNDGVDIGEASGGAKNPQTNLTRCSHHDA